MPWAPRGFRAPSRTSFATHSRSASRNRRSSCGSIPGYRIGIHSDVPTKAITVQFYLPQDDSQRDIGTIFHEGESGEAAERITKMPFLPASGYAFPVTETESWHSAAQTTVADGERVSMMVTYYVDHGLWLPLNNRIRRLGLRLGIAPRG